MSQSSTKRAALYLRQSLDRAEGIESQRKRCTALAVSRGWQIIDTFDDNETKASEERGPDTGWGRMLPRIGKDFDIVVSVDLDRLARNTRDLNKLIDLGAAVITVDGEIDLTSADGEFRATMIVSVARFETRRASERQKRHKAAKAERGEWHGGTPPYGYEVKQGKLFKNPGEVKLIKEAARRLLDNYEPMHSIIVDWNNPKVPGGSEPKHATRGGYHWRQSNLRHILMNRAMLGETKAGVVGWEPIIDQETFDRLQNLLTDPSRKVVHSPGVKGGKYSMGGGLTVCAKCGKPLITSTKSNSSKGKHPSLACLRRVHGPSEHHPQEKRTVTRSGEKVEVWQDTGRVAITHDVLERFVFERAIERLNSTEHWQARKSEKDPAIDVKISKLNSERSDLFARRTRAEDMALDGLIDKQRLRDERTNINARIEQIGKDIDKLVDKPSIREAFGDLDRILASWPKWTSGQRRAFLKMQIDRVVVDEYPAGYSRRLPRFKSESDSDYADRTQANRVDALKHRVRIEWRDEK